MDWGQVHGFCRLCRAGSMVVEVPSSAMSRPPVIPGDARPPRFGHTPLVAFFVLAYGFSWAWVIPWAATGHTVVQGVGWPTHFPSLLGPLVAAFVVTGWTAGRRGVRDLFARMGRWRIGWRWWLVVFSQLVFFFVVLGVMDLVGADLPAGATSPASAACRRGSGSWVSRRW